MRRESDDVSTRTFEGVSTLTVKQGDITLEAKVEDLTVEVVERFDSINYGFGSKLFKSDATYAIRHTKMVPDEDGKYMTIRKDLKKPVLRTARIEVEAFTTALLEAARIACEAPESAEISTYTHDEKKEVRFAWQTK